MGKVAILGVFVADCTFRAERPPEMGETILGKSFALGPGGKGSNQAVAAAKAGADTRFLSKLGDDAFAEMALAIWRDTGVSAHIRTDPKEYTGAAYIYVDDPTGNNAIIICPGVATSISGNDVADWETVIAESDIFMTQLEQPVEAAMAGLRLARDNGVRTILNPAPAAELPDDMIACADFVTPNESEAEALTGVKVDGSDTAEVAANALLRRGAGSAIITLGKEGVLYSDGSDSVHIPALRVADVVETTGAGDAFNGGFAAALSGGAEPVEALRFATATAALSVTRAGTAQSMPARSEIDTVISEHFGRQI